MAAAKRLPALARRDCRSSIHRRTKPPNRRRLKFTHQQLLTIPLRDERLVIASDRNPDGSMDARAPRKLSDTYCAWIGRNWSSTNEMDPHSRSLAEEVA